MVAVTTDVPLLPVDEEERLVTAMVGIPSLGKEEVIDVRAPRLPEVVGCEEMVVVDTLSVECMFELEEAVGLLEGVGVTVVIKSAVVVIAVPEMIEDGWVDDRKVVGVDVSVTGTKAELSDAEYVAGGLGEVTWAVAVHAVLVPGSEVTKVDIGVLYTVSGEPGCEPETDIEDRALLVREVNTLEVTCEELTDIPNVSGPVVATEDVVGEVTVVSVMSDSVGRPVAGLAVLSPVDVAAEGVGEGGCPAPVTAEAGGGGPVGVGAASVAVVVSVEVDSAVVWGVGLVTGADGTLPVCVAPTLLAEMDADVAGILVASGLAGFPALEGSAVLMVAMAWPVLTRGVSVFWVTAERGLEAVWVEVPPATVCSVFPRGEGVRAVAGMVWRCVLGEEETVGVSSGREEEADVLSVK